MQHLLAIGSPEESTTGTFGQSRTQNSVDADQAEMNRSGRNDARKSILTPSGTSIAAISPIRGERRAAVPGHHPCIWEGRRGSDNRVVVFGHDDATGRSFSRIVPRTLRLTMC